VDANVVESRWLTSAADGTDTASAAACAGCGGIAFGPEGYCEHCGQLRNSAQDHTELDLGRVAAVTDRGLRHHRNEDSVGLGVLAGTLVAIVCDGVSSSRHPEAASAGAVAAAATALDRALRHGETAVDAIHAATRAAQAAATLAAGAVPGPNPPASTFVCAVVSRTGVTVGWVGDSRAYWLPDGDGEPACLTVDDSVGGRARASGALLPPGVPDAQAGALVRWLGADATDTQPHVRAFTPPGRGRVLVCSDGLFKYRPDPAGLAAVTPREAPLRTVQELVRFALEQGGADNITAAIVPYEEVHDHE
jgi:serine/threonine protein phosphatase PrpC